MPEDIIQPKALKRLRRNVRSRTPKDAVLMTPTGTRASDMSVPNKRNNEDGGSSVWWNDLRYSTGSVAAPAIPGTTYGYYDYHVSGVYDIDLFRAQISGYSQIRDEITLENTYTTKQVSVRYYIHYPVAIADGLFDGQRSVKRINIREKHHHWNSNPAYLIYNSDRQREVGSVRHIGNYAFRNTGVTSANLEKVWNIGAYAFYDAFLSNINLNETKMIGDYAFWKNSLTNSYMPNVRQIGQYAFANNSNLSTITMNSVERIGAYAFNNTALTSVSLPSTLRTIEEGAFKSAFTKNSSSSVSIPSSVTSIENYAFSDNPRITTINYYPSVGIPAYFAQNNTGLSSLSANDATSIGAYAFYNTGSFTASFPNVRTVYDYAFGNSRVRTASFSNLTSLGSYAFNNATSLTRFDSTGSSTLTINSNAFNGTSSLSTVDIRGPLVVNSNGFYGATNLSSVNIPNVSSIGTAAFSSSSRLSTLDLNGNVTINGSSRVFHDNTTVNINRIRDYNGKDVNWQSWGNPSKINFKNGPYDIKKDSNNNITITGVETGKTIFSSLVIPDRFTTNSDSVVSATTYNVTKIGDNAFNKDNPQNRVTNNTTLTSVQLPSSITEIGDGAFANNTSLRTVKIDTTKVTEIKANTFKNTGLDSISLSRSVKTIGNEAFKNTSIQTVNLPDVTTVGERAFESNNNLTTVNLPEVTTIKAGAFSNNPELTTVIIPKAATIEAGAFINCPKLTNIVLNGNVNINASTRVFDNNTTVNINRLRDDAKDANWASWGNPKNIKYANSPFNYEKDIATGEITLTGFETGKSSALEKNFVIPEEFEITRDQNNGINAQKYTVKKIKANAFKNIANISASKITVPDSITEIGANAFDNVGQTLEEVVLPNTMTILGAGAFANNSNLTKVNIPSNNSLTKIENDVFKNTGLLTVSIPNNITEIGDSTFENTKINGNVLLPNITKIGEKSFAENEDIISVVAPKLEIIDDEAFINNTVKTTTKLSTISIPNITLIGEGAFKNNANLKNASLSTNRRNKRSAEQTTNIMPETLRTIKAGAFLGTGFDSMELNGNVQIQQGTTGNMQVFNDTSKVYINRVKDKANFDTNEENWGGKISYLNKPNFTTVYESNPNGTYKATITMTTPQKLVIDSVNIAKNDNNITVTQGEDVIVTSSNGQLKQRTIVLDNIPYNKTTDFTFDVVSLTKNISNKTWNVNKKVEYLHKDDTVASNISGRYYPDGFEIKASEPNLVPSGQVFIGWSETKNASTSIYPPQTPISINGNITLYSIFGDKLPDSDIHPTETTTTTEEKPSSTTTEKPSEETTAVTTENKTETTTQFVKDYELQTTETTTQFIKDGTEITTTNTVVTDENGNIINKDNNLDISIDKDGNIVDKNGNIIIDKNGNIINKSGITLDKNGNVYLNGVRIIDKNGYVYDNKNNIIGKIKINTELLFEQNEDKELIQLVEKNNENGNGQNLDGELKLITEQISESLLESLNKRGKQISDTRKAANKPSEFKKISKFIIIIVLSITLLILAIYYLRKKKSFDNDKKDLEI